MGGEELRSVTSHGFEARRFDAVSDPRATARLDPPRTLEQLKAPCAWPHFSGSSFRRPTAGRCPPGAPATEEREGTRA